MPSPSDNISDSTYLGHWTNVLPWNRLHVNQEDVIPIEGVVLDVQVDQHFSPQEEEFMGIRSLSRPMDTYKVIIRTRFGGLTEMRCGAVNPEVILVNVDGKRLSFCVWEALGGGSFVARMQAG